MNKSLRIAGIAAVLAATLALMVVVTGAFAQGPSTPDPANGSGQMRRGSGAGLGIMAVDEADMHAAIADALGMSLEDFEAALAEGKTPYLLASEQGIDFADILTAMEDAHADALKLAVAEGLITQERADWMLSRQAGGNYGVSGATPNVGNMVQGAGNMARGAGSMAQGSTSQGGYGGDCPYATP